MNYPIPFRFSNITSTIAISALLIGVSPAVVIGQIDDFQDGTTQGWVNTLAMANAPINQANAGPAGAGDNALFGIVGGPSDVFSISNSSQWAGDYTAASITSVRLDIANLGAAPLDIGILINGGAAGTTSVHVPVTGAWATYTIDLTNLLFGSPTNLSAVSSIELVNLPGGVVTAVGAQDILIDNITAVPEPSGGMLGILALGSFVLRRRRNH